MNFQFFSPTKIFFGPLGQYANEFDGFGKRALIVTGRSSAANGSLGDTIDALNQNSIAYEVFDKIEENPSTQNVQDAANAGIDFGAAFVVGVGGGSPLDAAKAAALLINNKDRDASTFYDPSPFTNKTASVLAIPTTAGTGSEVTPFAILTRHDAQTKGSIPHLVYPDKAFLCPKYTATLPKQLAVNTALDALCHLTEGYLTSKANPYTDMLAEGGLVAFGGLKGDLVSHNFNEDVRTRLLLASTLAGLVITHTKTSLPHQMGYALTYHHNVHHGAACGLLLADYLKIHPETKKTQKILGLLGFAGFDELKKWIRGLLNSTITLTDAEIERYSKESYEKIQKAGTHPGDVGLEDIKKIFYGI